LGKNPEDFGAGAMLFFRPWGGRGPSTTIGGSPKEASVSGIDAFFFSRAGNGGNKVT